MKKKFFALAFIILAASVTGVLAQRNVTPAIERDPLLEADAKHNLDVANQYFNLKKAYKSVIMRFEETHIAYPEFSKMDEFLYIAGTSSFLLYQNKGKQKIDLKNERDREQFAPEKLKEKADKYLNELIENYPESKYVDQAKKTLEELKAVKE